MYIIKYAFFSLWREKQQTLLIAITSILYFFLLVNISGIHSSIQSTMVKYQDSLNKTVQIFSSSIPSKTNELLTEEDYRKFGQTELVEAMDITMAVPALLENATTAKKSESALDANKNDGIGLTDSYSNQKGISTVLFASMNQSIDERLSKNSRKLVRGSSKLLQNECLIDERFAELNKLTVGSKILIQRPKNDFYIQEELTVAGIWQETARAVTDGDFYTQKEIMASYDTLSKMQDPDNSYILGVIYHLKKVENFKAFKKEVLKKGLPDEAQIVSGKETPTQVLSSIKSLKTLALTLLLSVFALGMIVLLFCSFKLTKKREHEVYTLISFGMKKRMIVSSQFLENFMLIGISLVIAIVASRGVMEIIDKILVNGMNQLYAMNNDFTSGYKVPIILTPLAFVKETLNVLAASIGLFLTSYLLVSSYQLWVFNPVKFLLEGNSEE